LDFNDYEVYLWFFICVLGAIAMVPIHFRSVEHLKLHKRYGKTQGDRIGGILGFISGWGFFLFWIGVWISPQPRFILPIAPNLSVAVPVVSRSVPLLHLLVCLGFLIPGAWFGVNGVRETTLKVAETHRTERIVTQGVYSIVRHPQYLGGLLAHMGVSFLVSAAYSLLSSPLMILLILLISWKEEKELIIEFHEEYDDYKKNVPMLLPRLGRRTEHVDES
jgi:protein-S-isoprenylcysteine O-methyltransferase Ste14